MDQFLHQGNEIRSDWSFSELDWPVLFWIGRHQVCHFEKDNRLVDLGHSLDMHSYFDSDVTQEVGISVSSYSIYQQRSATCDFATLLNKT